MAYLFDTCALSALYRPKSFPRVVERLLELPRDEIFIPAVSIGELQRGIEMLPASKERSQLTAWFELSILNVFRQRVLAFDSETALIWGSLRARLHASGLMMQAVDSLIAATAIAHGHVLVTRNENDFINAGVRIYNPWNG